MGNVPFADVALHDPRYNPAWLKMHNHFIVKSLQMVRPGGVVAVLTSRWTMDATNPAARRAMSDLADLVCAVRLPSKTHWRAAGTEAVTDVLILRRREPDRAPAPIPGWLTTVPAELTGPRGELEMVPINSYWSELFSGCSGSLCWRSASARPPVWRSGRRCREQVPALARGSARGEQAEAQHAGLG